MGWGWGSESKTGGCRRDRHASPPVRWFRRRWHAQTRVRSLPRHLQSNCQHVSVATPLLPCLQASSTPRALTTSGWCSARTAWGGGAARTARTAAALAGARNPAQPRSFGMCLSVAPRTKPGVVHAGASMCLHVRSTSPGSWCMQFATVPLESNQARQFAPAAACQAMSCKGVQGLRPASGQGQTENCGAGNEHHAP